MSDIGYPYFFVIHRVIKNMHIMKVVCIKISEICSAYLFDPIIITIFVS
jgi:hypothetical protein